MKLVLMTQSRHGAVWTNALRTVQPRGAPLRYSLSVAMHRRRRQALSAQAYSEMEGSAAVKGSERIGHVAAAAMRARTEQEPIALVRRLSLIVNCKQDGMVHRLSEASRRLARDRRRTQCGWRAGSAVGNVRFCSTSVWPPPGTLTARLCSKCFPSASAHERMTALSNDPIVKTD